eukprot:6188925-Pleurochrysis_carterae.AAC.1
MSDSAYSSKGVQQQHAVNDSVRRSRQLTAPSRRVASDNAQRSDNARVAGAGERRRAALPAAIDCGRAAQSAASGRLPDQ